MTTSAVLATTPEPEFQILDFTTVENPVLEDTIASFELTIKNNGSQNWDGIEAAMTQVMSVDFGDGSQQNYTIGSLDINETTIKTIQHTYATPADYNLFANIYNHSDPLFENATTSIQITPETYTMSGVPTAQTIVAYRNGEIYSGNEFTIEYTGNIPIQLNANINLPDAINPSISPTNINVATNDEETFTINMFESISYNTYTVGLHEGNITLSYEQLNGTIIEEIIPINLLITNQAPIIDAIDNTYVILGDSFSYTASATDVEGDDFSYSLVNTLSEITINESTGVISWTPTSSTLLGTAQAVHVSVTDEYGESSDEYFNIEVFPPYGVLSTTQDGNDIDEISFIGDAGDSIAQTITVRNEGNCVLSATTITESSDSEYNFMFSPNYIGTLEITQDQNIILSATIPSDMEPGTDNFGTLQIQSVCDGSTIIETFALKAQTQSKLQITDVDIEITDADDDTDSEDITEDETIDVNNEDEIELIIEISNLFEDVNFENIDVEIELDDWSLSFSPDEDNNNELDANETDDFDDFILSIPESFVDSDDAEITIKISGEEEDTNVEHTDTFTFYLDLQSVYDQISIIEYKILDQNYHEINDNIIDVDAEYFFIDVTVENTGEDNQDDVIVSAESKYYYSNDFNQEINSTTFDLDSGDDVTKRLKMWTLDDGLCGSRWINLVTYYEEDEKSKDQLIAVVLEGCASTSEPDDNDQTDLNDEEDDQEEQEDEESSNWFSNNSGAIGDYIEGVITRTDASVFKDRVKVALFVTAGVAILAGLAILVVRKVNK